MLPVQEFFGFHEGPQMWLRFELADAPQSLNGFDAKEIGLLPRWRVKSEREQATGERAVTAQPDFINNLGEECGVGKSVDLDRKSTRLNSSHVSQVRMP